MNEQQAQILGKASEIMSKVTQELSPMELYPEHFEIVNDFGDVRITVKLLHTCEFCSGEGRPNRILSAGTLLCGFADQAEDGTICIVDDRYGSLTMEMSDVEIQDV